MPLVKRGPTAPSTAGPPQEDGPDAHIGALRNADPDARWRAARALGDWAEAVPPLAAALGAEQVPRVREAMMTALMRIGDQSSVMALLPYLRSQDAALRAAAIEALQALPEAVLPFMASLLGDSETDVRILATELARNMPAADATHLLCGLLENEQHPNVCAAAIEVLAEVGTREALPALAACAERFSATPFLPFAVSVAVARISATEG
jgi:HEAT repeat protein